ncbi:MAG: hypothetical protein GDYSWBUE_001890 [Candidatus Fervidibacterota bacterium]
MFVSNAVCPCETVLAIKAPSGKVDGERMKRYIVRSLNNRKGLSGQALLELAVGVIILVLIVSGILFFGQMFNYLHLINTAAREGARNAALCKTDSEVIAVVRERLSSLPNYDKALVLIDPPQGSRVKGGPVTVTVIYDAKLLPGIPRLIGSERPIVARATFRWNCD